MMATFTFDGLTFSAFRPDEFPSTLPQRSAMVETVNAFLNKEAIHVTTSGSTGKPKRITHRFENVVKSALSTAHFFVLPRGSSALLALPVDKIAGKMMVMRALVNDWNLHIVPLASDPLTALTDAVDFAALTPHQLTTVLDNDPSALRKMRTLILGGAPVSHALEKRVNAAASRVYETYGMTETLTHVAVRRISPDPERFFCCLPGIRIDVDENEALLLNGDRFEGPLTTTDRVKRIDSQRFVWLGRTDFTVNSGGIKLQPERIEQALEGITERVFLVGSEPCETLGQRLVLFIEGNRLSDAEEASVRREIDLRLNRVERPKDIRYVAQFDRTSNGKIKRFTHQS
jgi:O-succinylbenzoic acid--CoA ligase